MGLPLNHLLNHRIGDFRDKAGRDIGTVHLFKHFYDLSHTHALCIQEQNFIIHGGKTALVFFD